MPFGEYGLAAETKIRFFEFRLDSLKQMVRAEPEENGLPLNHLQAHFEAGGLAFVVMVDELAAGVAVGPLPRISAPVASKTGIEQA
jgi:hypothetical protein